jgi:hypothetical protein
MEKSTSNRGILKEPLKCPIPDRWVGWGAVEFGGILWKLLAETSGMSPPHPEGPLRIDKVPLSPGARRMVRETHNYRARQLNVRARRY